ncbi:MAG: DMT family protein [Gemmatimonadaceae bacterium]|nr:DMT family protein [Gemmatimonadaceae bacterium]
MRRRRLCPSFSRRLHALPAAQRAAIPVPPRRSLGQAIPVSRPPSVVVPPLFRTVALLALSNVFMTFAWYAHLKNLSTRAWYIAALASWGIALFEYLLQVPANRIGYTVLSLPQLKIMQEAITLAVFIPFAVLYMKTPLKLDYLWAALCILGAVYFMFRAPTA